MSKVSEEPIRLLEEIAKATNCDDLQEVLAFCIQKTWNEVHEAEDLPESERLEIRRRCEAVDRGETIEVEDLDKFFASVAARGKARAAGRNAELAR